MRYRHKDEVRSKVVEVKAANLACDTGSKNVNRLPQHDVLYADPPSVHFRARLELECAEISAFRSICLLSHRIVNRVVLRGGDHEDREGDAVANALENEGAEKRGLGAVAKDKETYSAAQGA